MRGRRRRLPEGHWLARVLAVWVINALALLFLSWLLRGFDVDGFWASAMLAAVMGLMNAIIWPLCIRFALPLTVMTLGLGVLVLNAVFIWIASEALDEVYLADLWSGLWVAIGVTIMNTVVTSLFAIDDDDFYYRNVIKRQAQRSAEPESDLPGVLILEVDGLAHDVLRRALRDGNAPTLARWIAGGRSPPGRLGV